MYSIAQLQDDLRQVKGVAAAHGTFGETDAIVLLDSGLNLDEISAVAERLQEVEGVRQVATLITMASRHKIGT